MNSACKDSRQNLYEDKFMRVLLMFDVPTKTKKEQKYATRFRNALIKQGFFMMQFSVYMRICKGISSAKSAVERVRGILPPLGNVRTLIITEKQFDNMQILLGSVGFNERINEEKNLVLFDFDEKMGDYRYLSEDSRESGESSSDLGREGESSENVKREDKSNKSSESTKSTIDKQKPKTPIMQSVFEF